MMKRSGKALTGSNHISVKHGTSAPAPASAKSFEVVTPEPPAM
jgi:hypothetical protein